MIARAGPPLWIRILRIVFAVLGIVALLWIPLRAGSGAGFSLGSYLSYFTIESNIVGVVVLLITGVVYAVLLSGIDVMLTNRRINDTLHRVLPIVPIATGFSSRPGCGSSPG